MKKIAISMLAAAGALAVSASPAAAAKPGSGSAPNCDAGASVSSLSVTGGTVMAACGFFDGNSANGADYVQAAFTAFGLGTAPAKADWGVTSGGKTWTGEQYVNALSQDLLGTAGPLFGDIVVAFHTGNGNADWGNSTAFFLIQAGATGVTSILPNPGSALSGATLYMAGVPQPAGDPTPRDVTSAVPEPATWAMMLGGFGLVGLGMRRRSRLAAVTA